MIAFHNYNFERNRKLSVEIAFMLSMFQLVRRRYFYNGFFQFEHYYRNYDFALKNQNTKNTTI